MAGQKRVRREFQTDKGGKNAESKRRHAAYEGDRCLGILPVSHEFHGKIQNNRNGFI